MHECTQTFFFFLVLPAELMDETYGVKIQGKELIATHRAEVERESGEKI